MKNNAIVEFVDIWKEYPGIIANKGINLCINKGEVHSLLGENGAGKTTLMNLLYGLTKPSKGEVKVNGNKVEFSSSNDAIRCGLGMVHQHFVLVPSFTVAANIVLGQESSRYPWCEKEDEICKKILEVSESYGLKVNPRQKVRNLSVGEMQRVEIVKALYRGAEVLIMDEPTAVLTPQEVDELLIILKKLVVSGKTIIYITHKLREVMDISDRISILRAGELVKTINREAATISELSYLMVGREVNISNCKRADIKSEEIVLQFDQVNKQNEKESECLKNISFNVNKYEIFGIAGVAGNGQETLEEVVTGLAEQDSGKILLNGKSVSHANTSKMISCGLSKIPSDRNKRGYIREFTIKENLLIKRFSKSPFSRFGRIKWKMVNQEAKRLMTDFDIRSASINVPTGTLSGGNAQKVILAREITDDHVLMFASQPTRGLDIGAIESIHNAIIKERDSGVAIVLISYDLDEILALSDKVAVMYEGHLTKAIPITEISKSLLGKMMGGSISLEKSYE